MGEADTPNAPTTEDQLIAVTIGKPIVLNSTIELHPYNPDWPARYARLAAEIRAVLGDQVLLLEHAGSTAIPGISAKPVIDIVLAVGNSADERAYVPPLERAGFVLRIREPGCHEHRMFKAPVIESNLHVFSEGCEEISRMLAFRDWLRTNEADRSLYERKKQELAARTWKYMQNYADAKSEIVSEILARARGAS